MNEWVIWGAVGVGVVVLFGGGGWLMNTFRGRGGNQSSK